MKQVNASAHNTIALHRIDIASPCTASWEKMKGDERVRHCDDCNKNVFNLSAMPEAEAAALLAENVNGALCVRFYRRADGTVMTSDCGTSAPALARRTWRKLPGMAGMAVLAAYTTACNAAEGPIRPGKAPPAVVVTMGAPPAPMLMGDINPPATPPSPPSRDAAATTPAKASGTKPFIYMGKPIMTPAPATATATVQPVRKQDMRQ